MLYHAHASTAATQGGLDEQRIADVRRFRAQPLIALVIAEVTRDHRNSRIDCALLCLRLGSHDPYHIRRGADEGDIRTLACLGKRRILRKKAIARMQCVGAAILRYLHQTLDVKITLERRCGPEAIRFVRHFHMHRIRVRIGIHRDGRDPETLGSAHDPTCDFSAVGDDELLEHRHVRNTPKRASTSVCSRDTRSRASPTPRRVSGGSMMPSSQSRALA